MMVRNRTSYLRFVSGPSVKTLRRVSPAVGFVALSLTLPALLVPQAAVAEDESQVDGSPQGQATEAIDFRTQVRPLLTDHCFQCHGPDAETREAGLRLDTFKGATTPSDSGYAAVVPGKPDESELIYRVTSDDDSLIMPPFDHGEPLAESEVEVLRRWIAEGAEYARHWAFVSPEKPELPEVSRLPSEHPVDRLVADRLAEKGLQLSSVAKPNILCRRIYLDLIGLPPSPAQVAEFEQAAEESLSRAVSQLVDRLLASKHFGEKWGRHWLDIARYADSNGFEKDLPREQWAYRDWVIDALNEDKPYDEFIVEQIAGDLLPNRTQDQLIAAGFLRNGMVNEEGAIVPEQFRVEGIFDRMDCVGKAVLGLSLQCAQCHTHKFDPITHDEYYGMFAFLNDTHEAKSWVYNEQQQAKLQELRQQIDHQRHVIREKLPDWETRLEQFVEQTRAAQPAWEPLDCQEHVWEGGLNHPEKLADRSLLILGHPTVTGAFFAVAKPQTETITEVRLEALCHGDLPFGGPGRSYWGTFAISEMELFFRTAPDQGWQPVKLATAHADYEEPAHPLEDYFHHGGLDKEERRQLGPAAMMIDGNPKTAWRGDRGPILRHQESAIVARLAEPLQLPPDGELKIRLNMSHGGDGNGRDNQQLGRLRFAVTDGTSPALVDHRAWLAMQKPADERTEEERLAIFNAWRKQVQEVAAENEAITALQQEFPEAETSVLHIAATAADHRRTTRLLDRGAWDQPKHVVARQVPDALHEMDWSSQVSAADAGSANQEPTRLDFAQWLVDSDSPLAARVHVNRVWQAIFGQGLVETSEDFGVRAPSPEHQAVLDWLAVEFVEQGWSQKHLIRTILTSHVYQQTSQASDELLEVDPRNRWLTRGPRFRADAEVIRDIALTVAGLIHLDEVGGPSFYPPVPQSVLDYNYVRPTYWEPPQDETRYRRSLYMFRKRSMPDPVLTTFDSPNSDTACARRVRSNTPLAALVSLNEPVFVEAARALAERILREGAETEAERIDYAYRLCTARHATAAEQQLIKQTLEQQRTRIRDDVASAHAIAFGKPANRETASAEEPPKETDADDNAEAEQQPQPPSDELVDRAAWVIVARVLLNLDETLCKN